MNLIDYHKAISNELIAVKNKVRNLVPHWGEDGRYKELVLRNVIRRFLPEKYTIATGFVIQTAGYGTHQTSTQIDLIIYDNSIPVLFKEGDFVILTPDAVRGIIEVKTNLRNLNLTDILEKANRNGRHIYSGKDTKSRKMEFFNGIFSYEGYDMFTENHHFCDESFKLNYMTTNTSEFDVNHISFDKNWFLKVWDKEESSRYLYYLEDLSFSFFISNLMRCLSGESITNNSYIWFAKDKNQYQKVIF